MPTARFKPWTKRKRYCRKKGGGAFHFKGGSRSPRATANFLGASASAQQATIMDGVRSLLGKMGFRVKGGDRLDRSPEAEPQTEKQ